MSNQMNLRLDKRGAQWAIAAGCLLGFWMAMGAWYVLAMRPVPQWYQFDYGEIMVLSGAIAYSSDGGESVLHGDLAWEEVAKVAGRKLPDSLDCPPDGFGYSSIPADYQATEVGGGLFYVRTGSTPVFRHDTRWWSGESALQAAAFFWRKQTR